MATEPSLFDLPDPPDAPPSGPPAGPPAGPPGGSGGTPPSGSDDTVVALHEAAQARYLNYALSTITQRALPDARDGLKPVHRRILHGMRDDAGPWQLSLDLCDALTSDDVRVHFVKSGDHRLSEEPELRLLCDTVDELGRRAG